MLSDWIASQRALLALEKQEEELQLASKLASLNAKECEEEGISILHLEVESIATSMFGRSTVTVKPVGQQALKTNASGKGNVSDGPKLSMKVGDEVKLHNPRMKGTADEDAATVNGVISKIINREISIVCEDVPDEELLAAPLRLDLRANDYTFRKMSSALTELEEHAGHPLVRVAFDSSVVLGPLRNDYKISSERLFNKDLNTSQIEAVNCALNASSVALIHGPPGTGKTATLTEFILQAVALNKRLLVTAPSNIAVDNLLERITLVASHSSRHGMTQPRPLRLGHPARLTENTLPYCLDAVISGDEGTGIINDIRKEIDGLRRSLAKTNKRKDRTKHKEINTEIKSLRREIRRREDRVVSDIINGHNVILSTCVGAGNHLLKDQFFDYVVIDEAAQGLEASCWIPLLHTNNVCVLAGDHLQLPPTIKSKAAEINGLGVTLFERLIQDPNGRFADFSRLLDTQYRMNSLISDWASSQLYANKLKSHVSVANHSLSDLVRSEMTNESCISIPVMLLLDTAGCDMDESDCRGGSYKNEYEVDIVLHHVRMLVRSGVSPTDIGVITPYNGQLDSLKQALLTSKDSEGDSSKCASLDLHGIEIRTIDGFQGGEKECIILSLVRSNRDKNVGFLGDNRRINVAVTRAKRHLCIVCDSSTCGRDRFLNSLLQHVSMKGEHRSVEQYSEWSSPELWFAGDAIGGEEAESQEPDRAEVLPVTMETPSAVSSARSARLPKHKVAKPKVARPAALEPATASENKVSASTEPQEKGLLREIASVINEFASGCLDGGVLKLAGESLVLVESITLQACDRVLRFPSTLTSYHRMIVHDHANQLNLQHRSQGQANNRFIEIATSARAFKLCDESLVYGLRSAAAAVPSTGPVISASISSSAPTAAVSMPEPNNDSCGNQPTQEGEAEEEVGEATSIGDQNATHQKGSKKRNKTKKPSPANQHEQQRQQLLQKQAEAPKFYVSEERQKAMKAIASAGEKRSKSEAEAIDAAIAANEALRNLNKYRIPAAAMPNHEKNMNKARLHEKLEAARQERTGNKDGSEAPASARSRKTVLKKPPPNFGGGRLGGPA